MGRLRVKNGVPICPAKGCDNPADTLSDGRWTCLDHMCAHKPERLSAWYAADGTLCVACACGEVLKGGV